MQKDFYRKLCEQLSRQLEIERKLNASKQEQIDLLSDTLSLAEDQKQHLEDMLAVLKDIAADQGDERIVKH